MKDFDTNRNNCRRGEGGTLYQTVRRQTHYTILSLIRLRQLLQSTPIILFYTLGRRVRALVILLPLQTRCGPEDAYRYSSTLPWPRHRGGWEFSSTPHQQFKPGKDTVPILKEAGWARMRVWTGGIPRPHWDSISDWPACSQSLYRLSYPAQSFSIYICV